MLWTIIVILLVLWLLGLLGHVGGGLIHLLLVIAVIVLIINLIQGRRASIAAQIGQAVLLSQHLGHTAGLIEESSTDVRTIHFRGDSLIELRDRTSIHRPTTLTENIRCDLLD